MGNYRFKLSDMIPNAWFYKLRDMGKNTTNPIINNKKKKKKQQQKQQPCSTKSSSTKQKPHHKHFNPRKSYYFTRDLNKSQNQKNISVLTGSTQQPPRNSSLSSSSPFPLGSCSVETESPDPEFRTDRVLPTESPSFGGETVVPWSEYNSLRGCRVHSNANDIIIDVDNNSVARKGDDYGLVLPPIATKPAKFDRLPSDRKRKEAKTAERNTVSNEELKVKGSTLKVKIAKEGCDDTSTNAPSPTRTHQNLTPVRRLSLSSSSTGVRRRLRINSPRAGTAHRRGVGGRKSVSGSQRRSLSDSFAVVKSSFDPERDFRESMVEMIVENNIRTSKDLEDLLACYLSLNSDEYHGLIIHVFKQIWLDLTD